MLSSGEGPAIKSYFLARSSPRREPSVLADGVVRQVLGAPLLLIFRISLKIRSLRLERKELYKGHGIYSGDRR